MRSLLCVALDDAPSARTPHQGWPPGRQAPATRPRPPPPQTPPDQAALRPATAFVRAKGRKAARPQGSQAAAQTRGHSALLVNSALLAGCCGLFSRKSGLLQAHPPQPGRRPAAGRPSCSPASASGT